MCAAAVVWGHRQELLVSVPFEPSEVEGFTCWVGQRSHDSRVGFCDQAGDIEIAAVLLGPSRPGPPGELGLHTGVGDPSASWGPLRPTEAAVKEPAHLREPEEPGEIWLVLLMGIQHLQFPWPSMPTKVLALQDFGGASVLAPGVPGMGATRTDMMKMNLLLSEHVGPGRTEIMLLDWESSSRWRGGLAANTLGSSLA